MDLQDRWTRVVLAVLLVAGVVTGAIWLLTGNPEPFIVWVVWTAIVFASAAFFSRLGG